MLDLNQLEAMVFDFDGVLTDNKVYVDHEGKEMVCCHRADGLAFDVLRKLNKPSCILSTEKNTVVSARANKLGIPVLQGIGNKDESLRNFVKDKGYKLSKVLYVGNDVNDYNSMTISGFSACPADSHPKIKKISNFVLKTNGGKGVVRELLEDILSLDFIEILYKK